MWHHTIRTNSRSSNTKACWISSGTRSRLSCFPFPFDLGKFEETTREFKGARTKEVSAMNEESFWPMELVSGRAQQENTYFLNEHQAGCGLGYRCRRPRSLIDHDDRGRIWEYLTEFWPTGTWYKELDEPWTLLTFEYSFLDKSKMFFTRQFRSRGVLVNLKKRYYYYLRLCAKFDLGSHLR